jgi:hypothetical protein
MKNSMASPKIGSNAVLSTAGGFLFALVDAESSLGTVPDVPNLCTSCARFPPLTALFSTPRCTVPVDADLFAPTGRF